MSDICVLAAVLWLCSQAIFAACSLELMRHQYRDVGFLEHVFSDATQESFAQTAVGIRTHDQKSGARRFRCLKNELTRGLWLIGDLPQLGFEAVATEISDQVPSRCAAGADFAYLDDGYLSPWRQQIEGALDRIGGLHAAVPGDGGVLADFGRTARYDEDRPAYRKYRNLHCFVARNAVFVAGSADDHKVGERSQRADGCAPYAVAI